MKKLFSVLLATTMTVSLLAGCGSSKTEEPAASDTTAQAPAAETEEAAAPEAAAEEPAEEITPVELTYMTMQTSYLQEKDKINEALGKAYPGLSINFVHVADNYETTVKTKFAAGDPPDLFEWNGYLANKTFAEAGYFLDITDDNINATVMDQFKEAGMYDGRVYGIPLIAQASGLVYNVAAFEKAGITEPPKTISELKAACEKLTAAGITPFATGFKDVWVAHQMFWNVSGPNVGDFNTWYAEMAAGNASFKNDKTDTTFELIDIVLANTFENPLSSDAANMANKLATGQAGMCFQGVWQYPEYIKSDPEVKVKLAPVPVSENAADAIMEYEAQGVVFASANGKHTEEAKKVMTWLASPEGATLMAEINQQASPIKDVAVELNPLSQDGDAYVKAGGKTVGFIKTFWPSGLTTEVGKQLQSYISGTISKDEFFKNIDSSFVQLANQ